MDAAEALVAMNNVLAFVLFSLALPLALRDASVDVVTALLLPAYQLFGALVVSLAVTWLVTRIALLTRVDELHFRFALVVGAVMLTLGLAIAFKVSTLFAALTLGIACRWLQGRSRLTRVEFGGGADVFFIILFVFAGASLHLKELVQYAPVALAYVLVRTAAKMLSVYACGRTFGFGHRSAAATGMLLVPMAGLAIGLVQTTSALLPNLGGRVAAVVLAAVAVFETVGPPLAAFALRLSGDAGRGSPLDDDEPDAAAAAPAPDSGARAGLADRGGADAMTRYRRILLAWDVSVMESGAFDMALGLARAHGATLLLHHVLPALGLPLRAAAPRATRDLARRAPVGRRAPVHLMRRALAAARGCGVVCRASVETSLDVPDAIVRAARRRRCDLIVLGSHGETTLRRRLFGGVAARVARRAPMPVRVHGTGAAASTGGSAAPDRTTTPPT